MKQIPVKELDDEINVIVIRKPKNTLTLSAVFQTFKKLEILRIIESNVAAVGAHSFWGVPSLRILGKLTRNIFHPDAALLLYSFCYADLSRNNITSISEDNFKGQQNLLELNLAKNKMEQVLGGTFKYLTVSEHRDG